MTSGNFRTVPVDSITIAPDRQRKTVTGIEELADSIARSGLIHPPVITADHVLVAGERRLTAIRALGWTQVPVQFAEDLDPLTLHLIELEENIRRVDIDWKDQCLAVEKYHQLRAGQEKDWTAAKTEEALNIKNISAMRDVAKELEKGNEAVVTADKYSVARGIVQRAKARKKAEFTTIAEPEATPDKPKAPLLNVDFAEWAETYTGPRFNFIHCDFPYGVKVGGHGQAADQAYGNYNDDPETYWNLLNLLKTSMENVVDDSAHLMFWFPMVHYWDTLNALRDMDWKVDPYPLVWHKSDNTGIIPDANRGPRRNYETAFHCHRGDRFIVRAVSNTYSGAAPKTIHMSEKPVAMLAHFFRMYVDENSWVLDPTCGSANALKAAQTAGATKVLGLERDENFYKAACEAWTDE